MGEGSGRPGGTAEEVSVAAALQKLREGSANSTMMDSLPPVRLIALSSVRTMTHRSAFRRPQASIILCFRRNRSNELESYLDTLATPRN